MRLKESLDRLNSDFTFRQFIKENPKAYLCHFFMMQDSERKNDWQIGYYDPEKNLISMYTITKNEIVPETPAEPFTEPGKIVKKLEFDKIHVEYDNAIDTAKKCLSDSYPKEMTTKTLVLLQHLEKIGSVWNITFFTAKYDTINIKISAAEKDKILSHEQKSLIGFDPSEFLAPQKEGEDAQDPDSAQEENDFVDE